MSDNYVASCGQWKPVVGKYVVSCGQWKPVQNSYVVSCGQWKPTYVATPTPTITSFSAVPEPGRPWSRTLITINILDLLPTDYLVLIRTGGGQDKYWTLGVSTRTYIDEDPVYGVEYTYGILYHRYGQNKTFPVPSSGRRDQSKTRLTKLPTPTLRVEGITSHTAVLRWQNVPGTTTTIYRYTPGTDTMIHSWSTVNDWHAFMGLLAVETSYSYRVRRAYGNDRSDMSNKVTFKTSVSSYKGRYVFAPTQSYTFLPARDKRVYDKDTNWHGMPGSSSSRPHTRHVTVYHYYTTSSSSDPFKPIRVGLYEGLRIVRARVWLARRGAGRSQPIRPYFSIVRFKRRPSRLSDITVVGTTRSNDGVDEYQKNAEWVNLPISVATALIRYKGKGLALGNSNEAWYSWMNFVRDDSTVGRVEIVLGK